ncbi:serine hydrolase [Bacillus sp. Marseille-Q1617]|uniref:serine hydrolase n=1 Tax=Bacillus sp. Marseille-Q1617 TaxID=2736887 RepID=UPI00158F2710|nr:serine hydrolase [Bacillus sp. Marseille-Q1617]
MDVFKAKVLEEKIQRVIDEGQGRVSLAIELSTCSIKHNSEVQLSAASLIKLPILLQGFFQIQDGKLHPDEIIPVPQPEKVGGAGVLSHLSQHSKVTIHDLLTLMIIVSDNTATNLLIDRIGMTAVNEMCKRLGLKETELNRKLMDLDALQSGVDNQMSARDALTCLKAIDKDGMFHANSRESMLKMLHNQQFNQKLPAKINREHIYVANKTGELPGVEHDCAILRHKEHTVYAAVLIDGLKDNGTGSEVLARIGEYLNEYMMEGFTG